MTPLSHELTAYCLMSNAKAARALLRAGKIAESLWCLATLYNIAAYTACRNIALTACEEAMRIETQIDDINSGRRLSLTRPDSVVVQFPRSHKPHPSTQQI